MRKVVGRVALLLGVLLVAAAAWWGAVTLFDEDDRSDDDSSSVECVAASSRSDVVSAQRALVRKYGDARWFRAAGVKRTEEGFVLQVRYKSDRPPADLPSCQADVLVVAVRRR